MTDQTPPKGEGEYLSRTTHALIQAALRYYATHPAPSQNDRRVCVDLADELDREDLFLLETTIPRPTPVRWIYGWHDPMERAPDTIPAEQTCATWSDAIEALLDQMALVGGKADVTDLARNRRETYARIKECEGGWVRHGELIYWVRKLVEL